MQCWVLIYRSILWSKLHWLALLKLLGQIALCSTHNQCPVQPIYDSAPMLMWAMMRAMMWPMMRASPKILFMFVMTTIERSAVERWFQGKSLSAKLGRANLHHLCLRPRTADKGCLLLLRFQLPTFKKSDNWQKRGQWAELITLRSCFLARLIKKTSKQLNFTKVHEV